VKMAFDGDVQQQLALPDAPEAVQKWLRQEDWESLSKAWQEAEAQAIAWAEASDGEEQLWQEASQASFQPTASTRSLPQLSQTSSKSRRRPKWDKDFNLLGNDSRKPAPLRRYFDETPGEPTLPKHARGDADPKKMAQAAAFNQPEHLKSRRTWTETHHQTVSGDNEALHPHLRSYFDRRGLESCYRQRPNIDKTSKKLRPRTPGRPSTREKIMRFRSTSEPSLGQGSVMSADDEEEKIGVEFRHMGGIHWGARCQMTGTDKAKAPPVKHHVTGEIRKIPWVMDHHVSVSSDNTILHPALRHYFDVDGVESSFRNRGLNDGRPMRFPRAIFGELSEREKADVMAGRPRKKPSLNSSASWDSIHSSLLEKLSFSSLTDENTPSGLPGVRRAPGLGLGSRSPDPNPSPQVFATGSVGSGSLRSPPQGSGGARGPASIGSGSGGGGSYRTGGEDFMGQWLSEDAQR